MSLAYIQSVEVIGSKAVLSLKAMNF